MSEENGTTLDDGYGEWMVYRIDEVSVAHGYVIARTPSEALAVYEEQCNPDLSYGLSFEVLGIRLVRPHEEIGFRGHGVPDDLRDGPRVEVKDSEDGVMTVKATAATWAGRYSRPVTLCFSEW